MMKAKTSTTRKDRDVTAIMYHSGGTNKSTKVRPSCRSEPVSRRLCDFFYQIQGHVYANVYLAPAAAYTVWTTQR